eukprot:scaffold5515_cov39-Prasinocladus_malaysianus.AAC.1
MSTSTSPQPFIIASASDCSSEYEYEYRTARAPDDHERLLIPYTHWYEYRRTGAVSCVIINAHACAVHQEFP